MTEPTSERPAVDEAALEARLARNLGITAVAGGDNAPALAATRLKEIVRSPAEWNRKSRQAWLFARLFAFVFAAAIFVGWPLGDYAAWMKNTGSGAGWTYWHAITTELALLGVIVFLLTWFIGYITAALMQMHGAAQHIASATQQFLTPSETAADAAESVGAAVRREMDQLNMGLDGALSRLAAVEAMIRRHVDAIESAGERIEVRSTGAMAVVASERARLIDLTEQLNQHADVFAAAIADKAKASIEALHSADDLLIRAQDQLEDRLVKLDAVASQALRSFQALSQALAAADVAMKASVGRIELTSAETRKAIENAQKAADAAAESAARNAANVGAAAQLASQEAAKAARAAVEASAREVDRAARAAAETASKDAQRVVEASAGAINEVRRATHAAAQATEQDAARAVEAAARLQEAANRVAETSAQAAAEVAKASEAARLHAEGAVSQTERTAGAMEARNRELAEARAALEAENARLEDLIGEQRKRADRLADAIATQTERLSRLAETQIREQEATSRLAEAQAALQARAAEEARLAAEKEARRAEEERRLAAEAARVEQQRRKPQPPRRPPEESVLELDAGMRRDKPEPATRQRLDELADDIAQRRNGKPVNGAAPAPPKRDKQSVSWKEILDATENAEPLDLGAHAAAPKNAGDDAMKIIAGLQSFTVELERRLYGEPPAALRERFERGDRNIFAARLLRLNEADVKRRVRAETQRDKAFNADVHAFLQGFETLLEDATTSETVDEDLEEYLSSPLGRVYLLVGATVGYFA